MDPSTPRAPGLRRGEILASGATAALGCVLGVAADLASGFSAEVAFDPTHVYDLDPRHLAPLLLAKAPGEMLVGHYLAILGIPLGIAGVWQVSRALAPGSAAIARAFLWGGVLVTVAGTVYHATFAFVAHFLRLRESVVAVAPGVAPLFDEALPRLLALHQPLAWLLVLAMPALSALFALAVARGGSAYPRALALVNPLTLQLVVSGLAAVAPRPLGQLLFVVVFNASMLVFYLVSTATLLRGPSHAHRLR